MSTQRNFTQAKQILWSAEVHSIDIKELTLETTCSKKVFSKMHQLNKFFQEMWTNRNKLKKIRGFKS